MPFDHEALNHSVGEYVRGMAHTNGIGPFWAQLKRAYHGTYHHISAKHLPQERGFAPTLRLSDSEVCDWISEPGAILDSVQAWLIQNFNVAE